MHGLRGVHREQQLHLKVHPLCGKVEKVPEALVDKGAKVGVVKADQSPPDCLTTSWRPARMKVASGQYMVARTEEAKIAM